MSGMDKTDWKKAALCLARAIRRLENDRYAANVSERASRLAWKLTHKKVKL